ncbi:MAG: beta-mannosidase [Paracoccaceae bacterium]
MIDLSGEWQLADAGGRYKAAMTLPGDGISALHRAGLIPDPYWGRNEYDLRWICETEWTLRRTFAVDRTDLMLVIDMLDTVATVAVNGTQVLKADTMFRQQIANLSNVLRLGENEITITFSSVVDEANRRQAEQPFYVPYHKPNCPIPNGNMLRKPQCDFGWDWNIALAPFGVYGRIGLEPGSRSFLHDPCIRQTHHADGRVTVSVTALYIQCGAEEAPEEGTLTCLGVSATGKVENAFVTVELTLSQPELWWPAGQGAQVLHDLTLTVGNAVWTRRIGLRDLKLVTEKDTVGTGFKFRINGRDVFAKGANWIPADALAGNITREGVRDLLQSAALANMNMIRVWGGGRYEPDWFYDLCDELGLMVWQDFMFACHLYPSTEAFLTEVGREVRLQVGRLQHHACIALWCGDNELIGALNWFEESRANRDRYLVSYDRLNRAVELDLKSADPAANWWPSSPSPGPMSFGDAWHDDANGDMHFWSVWHEGRDFDHYRDVSPRFCSEFGFQSYPSMDVIRKFADPADWNIASPVMESHQKNAGGNARIAETMFRYFRFPVGFENFVYLSQVQQGLAIKTAVTHWRSLKPHCMGTLIWQLNDTWPVCSWSSLDHGGGWKLLHHMAKHFYAPVTVVAVPEGGRLLLKAVSDKAGEVSITVTARATDMAGQTREIAKATAIVGESATAVIDLPADALGPQDMLLWTWEGSDGSRGGDHFAPKPYKSYDLQPAHLTSDVTEENGVYSITVSADALALFVSLESDIPGRFSENAFVLFPGCPATITFTPRDVNVSPRFMLRDLHSATYERTTP